MRDQLRDLILPSKWEKGAGSRGNSRHLEIKETRIKYTGPGSADKDAASVRADLHVPPSLPLYYFEVEVVSKGREGYIGLGFCTADVNMDRLPGWEPQSYGYHGDDGNAFRSDGKGRKYGPQFETGDFVGACLNRADKTISYYKNGIDLGVAFHNVQEERLYPCIGMQTHDEEVIANFGQGHDGLRFRASVDAMRREAAQRMERSIKRVALPNQGRVGSLMGELIFGFMVHHAYWETAAAVARDMLAGTVHVQPKDIQEVKLRKTITDDVVAGNVAEAIQLADTLAPGMLAANPSLTFRLHLQTFFELVRARDDMGAISFGTDILKRAVKSRDDQELLMDALSLMGYTDATKAPCGQMMGQQARDDLARDIMSAIRSHTGRQQYSPLEKAYVQLIGVLRALEERGSPHLGLLGYMDLDNLLN
ncbi:hypothetical protein CVIRNUC_006849 [Coccomyxa viridis]|uniref:Uncharacterized protein n=1 Tax=Coccomyxa viridis TaxID=1274662 RepID=A0AAV1ICA4_9CHLO|nr:hypothetical protein CVIRNUC_006849 [Coccomyxa viridis]